MYQDHQQNPEEKYKTLINLGIAFSFLIILAIIIAIGVTQSRIANRDEIPPLEVADTVTTSDYAFTEDEFYSVKPEVLESRSDSIRKHLATNCSGCSGQVLSNHLEKSTDECARLIRELINNFSDSVVSSGRSSIRFTQTYFSNTTKDEELFTALFSYRETTEELATDENILPIYTIRQYLPLRDHDAMYPFTQKWTLSQFEQEPDDVLEFLKRLEIDLRNYEFYMQLEVPLD